MKTPICHARRMDARGVIHWTNGEPYEEPTQDYKATICKLSDMIYDRFTMDEDTATEVAAMLVANGVTFREE